MKIRIDDFLNEEYSAEDFEFEEKVQKKKLRKEKENPTNANIYKKIEGNKNAKTSIRTDTTK